MRITTICLLSPILITLFLYSCSEGNSDSVVGDEYYSEEEGFENGTYCADVEYFNPETGTRSEYSLNVDVENNELVLIHWPNGGWLDDDHFSPEILDEQGYCEVVSDRGYEFTITITGSECLYTDEVRFRNDLRDDVLSLTCPRCGGEKDDYDSYCDDCEDREEHTCSRCGNYDSFMFSSDDYCSDCEDELENTCSRCGRREYNVNGGLCRDCEEDENDDR